MKIPLDPAVRRFEAAFFTLFRKLGPELGIPADLSLTGPQMMILFTISSSGRCPVGQLAQKMEVTPGAISVMIDRLVNNGFVVRKYDPKDRRVVLLEITGQGREALEKIREVRTAQIKQYLAYLEPDELDLFLHSFEKIAAHIKQ
ncbi:MULTISPECIES: MarR family winged helix-turn-helix transcriptional regulator [Paenibacillus]|uniref:Uncharacterized protein n=1 Tax=Paenibacillus naphthalenovorans TaxID=162209 RepID=A0A0U2UJV0_9BACL|nr:MULTISPECIES: MarR family transcriptional regulator [Paenibacillus]ALS23436.1 hypothetical protein IJ22_30630 [Paenibacillus naphthalenovorans]NTZ17038.1 MarR family transcriptional regulator [Paenibacillus sp. JMULE4]GCL72909.1 MarR family transcriptional regulator [Paenibacillus naphthalenovorans]SDJ27244.1 DNA-binding transcriptional regulator, MarR family [Paenibacillus naphthalenovorans]